tara:strand:- start:1171 stop:1791 length:621 start_codon:yes stop_codon:yes gene_type:complete
MFRFGITSRITESSDYFEIRNSLSQDWANYFYENFPDDIWVTIPNQGSKSIEYFKSLKLNVLILSGGDNLGDTLKRDETEASLLRYALLNSIPVIGVCRGMQLIHSYFGGSIEFGNSSFSKIHKSKDHIINYKEKEQIVVNSYHTNKIVESTLSKQFSVLARCTEDNSIESFYNKKILSIMWHPERKMKSLNWSTNLLKKFLNNKL